LTAGNFSAFWMGMVIIGLMGGAWLVSQLGGAEHGLAQLMTVGRVDASPVFAFGLVAFGFLGMGPVTIAVDSYGPVTDNAQSIYELSLLHPPFLLGLVAGGAMIYWFTGASTQAVTTGAYRAVEFIKAHIRLEGVEKASTEDSTKVVQICTVYAQKGMINIFLAVFFG